MEKTGKPLQNRWGLCLSLNKYNLGKQKGKKKKKKRLLVCYEQKFIDVKSRLFNGTIIKPVSLNFKGFVDIFIDRGSNLWRAVFPIEDQE